MEFRTWNPEVMSLSPRTVHSDSHSLCMQIDANCANIQVSLDLRDKAGIALTHRFWQVGLSYCVFGPYVSYTPTITLPPTTSPSGPTTTTTTTTSAAPAPTNVANGTITEGCNSESLANYLALNRDEH